MHSPKIQETGNDRLTVEVRPPGAGGGIGDMADPGDTTPGPRPAESEAEPDASESACTLPPGQHPYDPVKKDIDPVAFALDRVQTFLVWIDEHRASFEQARDIDKELAEAELNNLRDSTSQGIIYLQRLSELLLAGYSIDPGKRLPESLRRGWFSSNVRRRQERGGTPSGNDPPGAG